MRPELRQPAAITNEIERLLDLDRMQKLCPKRKFSDSAIRALAEQFEALYCYAMMKSIIMSEAETENPKYACMVTGFKIERNTFFSTPYYGLEAYERNNGPI